MMRELAALEGVVELALPGSAALGPAGARRTVWEGEPVTVEIVAPDRFCAHLFLNLMVRCFRSALTHTVIGSGFDGSRDLGAPRAAHGSKAELRSPVRTARAASPRAGFRQTQIAVVAKP
jgi:hypothetical protein